MRPVNRRYKMIELYGALAVDLSAATVSYLIACYLRIVLPFGNKIYDGTQWGAVYGLCILGCLLYNLAINRYKDFFARGYLVEAEEVIKYSFLQFVTHSTLVYVFRLEMVFSRLLMGYFLVANLLICYCLRCLFKAYVRKHFRNSLAGDKVLMVCAMEELDEAYAQLKQNREFSYDVVRIAILGNEEGITEWDGIPVISVDKDFVDRIRQMTVDVVYFAGQETVAASEQWIPSIVLMGIRCYLSVQTPVKMLKYSGFGDFGAQPVLCYSMPEWDFRRTVVKRLMDILGASVGLAITVLLTPFIALAIKLDDPKGPIFFSQIRVGRNGRRFRMYKFRSMCVDAEEKKRTLETRNEMSGPIFKLENDPRITRVGWFLRRASLDELPQFWNILKGDMSLVGTRPPTVEEFEKYSDYYRRRLSITPGLTGLWQVSGRSKIKEFDEIVRMDLKYIDEWSLRSDIRILLLTAYQILFCKGSM